jgi:hypothetical protein
MTQRDILNAMYRGEIRASQRDAYRIRRARKERVRRQERLVWLVTAAMFAFIALALFCGPAATL